MIDPTDITNFHRSEAELQEFLMFCCVVAGKRARVQAKKLDQFINALPKAASGLPFDRLLILSLGGPEQIGNALEAAKIGQYKRLRYLFSGFAYRKPDLKTISVDVLESLAGIGPKTARFFLVHSRPDQRLAVLDTHILRFLSDQGFVVPSVTPSDTKYAIVESIFLYLCKQIGKSPAVYDLEIWNQYSAKANGIQTV